jgi:hypothetical protein
MMTKLFLFLFLLNFKDMRYFGVELIRQKFTDLSTTEKPCSDWAELGKGPGLAEFNDGTNRVAKSVEQCYWDYFHTNLGCRLPWSKQKS